ncbi:MAG: ligase-associated DNA damage response endonuclease PdeM [Pseudomonadota bacterium]
MLRGGEIEVMRARLVVDPSGALYWPLERMLLVADLHLERGAAQARRGRLLPPYDTGETLKGLAAAVARYEPARVACLGDSFDDKAGAAAMPDALAAPLQAMMQGRDWLWIAGNHDDESAGTLGGDVAEEAEIGPLVLRHHPQPAPAYGEVSGHLHPGACVALDGRNIRVKCVAYDATRAILPGFGALTGGLNVRAKAFHDLFDGLPHVMALGRGKAYPVPRARLV